MVLFIFQDNYILCLKKVDKLKFIIIFYAEPGAQKKVKGTVRKRP